MDQEDMVFTSLFLVVISKVFYENVYPDIIQAKYSFLSFLQALNTWKGYFIMLIIALPIILYLTYRQSIKYYIKKKEKQDYNGAVELFSDKIEEILDNDVDDLDYEEVSDLRSELEKGLDLINDYKELHKYESDLKEMLKDAKVREKEAKHEEKVNNLEYQRDKIKEELEALKKQKQLELWNSQDSQKLILKALKIEENPVFRKDDLNDKEFKVLLKNNYKQTNQYCVYERKLITCLVRPVSNHTITHIFLVWSTIKLLKTIKGIKNIRTNLSVKADIEFTYQDQLYAIEIETGNLLRKKEQCQEKVAYNNKKYGNRWMFVVSNKDLIWKYRKLAPSTQRNEVEANLHKMLNQSQISPPNNLGWSQALADDEI